MVACVPAQAAAGRTDWASARALLLVGAGAFDIKPKRGRLQVDFNDHKVPGGWRLCVAVALARACTYVPLCTGQRLAGAGARVWPPTAYGTGAGRRSARAQA